MADGASEQEPLGESLTPNAANPQGDAAPTQPVDTGAQQNPAAATPSNPPVENGSPDPTRDERGRFKASESDPVQHAIAKLAKPQGDKPPAEQPPKPSTPAKPGATAKAEPTKPGEPAKPAPAKPDAASSTTDPFADLTPPDAEKAHWNARTKERFDKVFAKTRELHTQLEELTPHAENGKQFASLLDEFGVRDDVGFVPPDHLAGVIKAQASLNRAIMATQQGRAPARSDLEGIAHMGKVVDDARRQFGLLPASTSESAVTPFAGELPADLKDLVEVYGIDEKRVRLLAALEGKATATPAKPQQQAQQPATPASPAQPRPEGVDMGQIKTRQWIGELQAAGDQNPAQTMRVVLAHPATKAEVMRRYPGTTPADVPAVFNALDGEARVEIMRAAHRAMTKAVPAPSRSTPAPPPTQQRTHSGPAPRAAAQSATGDPVNDAIAFLSGG